MTTKLIIPVILTLAMLFSTTDSLALDTAQYDELTSVTDSARTMEVDVFAPELWNKAQQKYRQATEAVDRNKKQQDLDLKVTESREFLENALRATEVARLSLQEYLSPRDKAKEAKAALLVPELWAKAEAQFVKATKKTEAGDVKNALKEAEKARPLYDNAEIEAIRIEIMGEADKLIQKVLADDAGKFAPSTLDRARSARQKANAIITSDRYNRDDATVEAKRAEYEARHASNIGLSVRALNRNDQAWEKLMLIYEIQMNRVGDAIGAVQLPFDEGPLAAADTLVNYITYLKESNERLSAGADKLYGDVSSQLKETLAKFGVEPPVDDPVMLAQTVDIQVSNLQRDKIALEQQLENQNVQMAELTEKHGRVMGELDSRLAREQRFKDAKDALGPTDGEVLFNAANDIVLRLSGLSFNSGKHEIQDDHIALLEKVKGIIEMFPDAQLVVEGHTDAQGDPRANVTLSEKRAYAVMQYLRQSMLIPADRIQSMGFGADRPVSSNKTSEGRAKNRRIDVILMQ